MNSKVLELSKSFDVPKKYWDTIHISGEQHTFERSKPAPYLKKAMEIAKELNLNRVVEIGATRFAITDKCIDYFFGESDPFVSPPCCNDGHGGIFWALNGFETHSVDIDSNCKTQAIWSFENIKKPFPPNLHLNMPQDGIKFLEEFDKEIEILFLDGWDVGTDLYREKHLEAFNVAKSKLSPIHLILIDDTDFEIGAQGKDHLLSPELLKLGYKLLFDGRQKLYINDYLQAEVSIVKEQPKTTTEMVNHPKHYGGEESVYEVVKVCEAWGLDMDAYLFNVVKYVARAGKKDPQKELEDLNKALWYLERRIQNLKK